MDHFGAFLPAKLEWVCVCVRPNVVNIEIKVGHQKVYTKIMDCIRPAFVHHFCVVGWGERERESSEA